MPNTNQPMGYAASDLGLGTMLADQVAGETDEQRKKRMREIQDRQMVGAGGGSLAAPMLLGGFGAGGY